MTCSTLGGSPLSTTLNSFYSLHIQNTRNFADAGNNAVEVLHVFNIDGDIDIGAVIVGAHIHVADVGIVVADHRRELLQQASAIVTIDRQLHRISRLLRANDFGFRPLNEDATVRFIHQVGHIGTRLRVHGNPLAASNVSYDFFSSDRITTTCAIDEQFIVSLDFEGIVLAANSKDTTNDAAKSG